MHERFLSYINSKNLIKSGDRILLAVSGGIDSMVMLHLFLMSDIQFAVAHINHKLRKLESDAEADFVRKYCLENTIKYFQFDIDPSALLQGNMHDTTRKIRYQWLEEVRSSSGFDCIATAHHGDDDSETFMINLMRGSGIDGLDGMEYNSNHIIRPILFSNRKQIQEFALEHSLQYMEDSSNATDKYLRNRIRHHVLPEIYKADQRAKAGLQISLKNLSETKKLLDFLVESYCSAFVKSEDGIFCIHMEQLVGTKMAVELLFRLLKPFGFNHHQCHDMIEKVEKTGNQYFAASYKATLDRKNLLITKISHETSFSEIFYIHPPCTIQTEGRNFSFELISSGTDIDFSNEIQYLASDQLKFPLRLRHWRPGDRFAPAGMGGKTQKIKDFLINNKVPRPIKNTVMVLENAGIIVSILNFRIAENGRIKSDTKKILKITTLPQK